MTEINKTIFKVFSLAIGCLLVYSLAVDWVRGDCLKNVHADYLKEWDGACDQLGLEKGCKLPHSESAPLGESLKQDNRDCRQLSPF